MRTALLALGGLAVFLALLITSVVLTSDHAEDHGLILTLVLLISLSFVGTGLFAWYRRPDNRTGAIMTAVGFAFLTIGFTASDNGYVFMIGNWLNPLPVALLLYLLLAFPTGMLRSNYERVLVAGGFLAAVVLQFPRLVVTDTLTEEGCDGCPANPILISANDTLASLISVAQNLIAVTVVLAGILVLVGRLRAASPSQKKSLKPVYTVGAASLISIMSVFISDIAGAGDATTTALYVFAIIVFTCVPYAFLFGLLRTRFSRAGAVGELVERLSALPAGQRELRDELSKALGDDDLEIAYFLPQQERYVDGEGRPVELPSADADRVAYCVDKDGQCVAAIIHDRALAEDPSLIRSVGAAASLTLENERLEAELRANLAELRASRARMVEASDAARRRLERDLHDGAQQHLVALSLDLKLARSMIDSDPQQTRELLDRSVEQLDAATAELRELARGIHPAVLTDRGLGEAVKALATRAPIPVEVSDEVVDRFAAPVESAAYFVIAEALTNVARYAQATHAQVSIARRNGAVTVEVRDDGVGGADPSHGSGLSGLADRVAALDGTMSVVSPPGKGTVVTAALPCA